MQPMQLTFEDGTIFNPTQDDQAFVTFLFYSGLTENTLTLSKRIPQDASSMQELYELYKDAPSHLSRLILYKIIGYQQNTQKQFKQLHFNDECFPDRYQRFKRDFSKRSVMSSRRDGENK
jgi:hypothetical protein